MPRGDWFLDLFTSEAEKLIDGLVASAAGQDLELPGYWWSPGLPGPEHSFERVAGVDGGGGVIELAGGVSVYVARAFGYVEDGEPVRLLELRLVPARDTRVLDALRSWLEHRAAVRLVHRLPPGSLLLMDGSYRATLGAALAAMLQLAGGRVQSVSGVYAGILSGHLVAEAASLAQAATERGVTLAYVSKDHRFQALKEKVLLERAAELEPGLEPLIRRSLDWYPLHARDTLLEARRAASEPARRLLDAALDPSYRDPAFIEDAVGGLPGYSWVLRLPPPRRLHSLVSRYTARGIAERIVARAEALLGGRDAEEAEALLDKLPRALDQLPAPEMLYARLGPGDQPLLVETPGPPGSLLSPGRLLEEPRPRHTALVAALASQYGGPVYYNTVLVAAHIHATLDQGQLAGYTRLLERLAAARGIPLSAARRAAMAAGLGSRRRRGAKRRR